MNAKHRKKILLCAYLIYLTVIFLDDQIFKSNQFLHATINEYNNPNSIETTHQTPYVQCQLFCSNNKSRSYHSHDSTSYEKTNKQTKTHNRSQMPTNFNSRFWFKPESLILKTTSVCTNGSETFVEKPAFASNFVLSDGLVVVEESVLKAMFAGCELVSCE